MAKKHDWLRLAIIRDRRERQRAILDEIATQEGTELVGVRFTRRGLLKEARFKPKDGN